jgi:hypothetical protein
MEAGTAERREHRRQVESRQPTGWTVFAGVVMLIVGSLDALYGLAAILNNEVVIVGGQGVIIADVTTWGWIHLILGIVVFIAGLSLFKGAIWARTVGVILGVISAVVGFAWLPWYPVWGIVIVVIAVSVIWALTMHGRDADLTHGDDVARY